jgi:hypothetical protein
MSRETPHNLVNPRSPPSYSSRSYLFIDFFRDALTTYKSAIQQTSAWRQGRDHPNGGVLNLVSPIRFWSLSV